MDNKGALKILNCCGDFSFSLNGINAKSVIGEADVDKVKRLAIAALEEQVKGNFSNNSIDDFSLQELIVLGYEQGIVKLGVLKVNESSEIICQIGKEWFCFGGETAEGYDSVEKFIEDIPVEDFLSEICDTLEHFGKYADCNIGYNTVYNYCIHYLKENINIRIIDAQANKTLLSASIDELSLLELITFGYEQRIVRLDVLKEDEGPEIICRIGEKWFPFGDKTTDGYDSVRKFKEDVPTETFLYAIYSELEAYLEAYNECGARRNENSFFVNLKETYDYCVRYLKENIVITPSVDRLVAILKNIQYQCFENGTSYSFTTQFNEFSLKQIAEEMIKMGVTFK